MKCLKWFTAYLYKNVFLTEVNRSILSRPASAFPVTSISLLCKSVISPREYSRTSPSFFIALYLKEEWASLWSSNSPSLSLSLLVKHSELLSWKSSISDRAAGTCSQITSSKSFDTNKIIAYHQITTDKANGPNRSPEKPAQLNKLIWAKIWLCHNVE